MYLLLPVPEACFLFVRAALLVRPGHASCSSKPWRVCREGAGRFLTHLQSDALRRLPARNATGNMLHNMFLVYYW